MDWLEKNGNVAAVVVLWLWYCGCNVVVAAVIKNIITRVNWQQISQKLCRNSIATGARVSEPPVRAQSAAV